MVHIIGIVISSFLASLLFTKKGKSVADFILGLWLIVIAFHLVCYYLLVSGIYLDFPYFLGMEIPLPLVHSPFFYLYVATLTNQRSRKLHWSIHFIPVSMAFLLLSGFLILPFEQKIVVYQNHGFGYEDLVSAIQIPIIPSGIIYISFSLLLLKRHHINIQRQFSYSEKINLDWLVYLTIGMIVIWISIIFGNDISTFFLVDLFVLFIGYFGVKQVGIFNNQLITINTDTIEAENIEEMSDPETKNPDDNEKVKYQKTPISDELMLKIHKELSLLMLTERLFKEPELNLSEVAKRLNIHSNTLSQVINSMEQRNFYDYINDFRVKEFQRIVILPENNKYTLLSLAFEVGFNSKTSFNRNFKKATGLSPTQFCQQEKIQLSNRI
ncbi:helix-turn-helix domain-containing protein [Sphingobacterium detergens]|uniref:AraC-like DNA-binding protein n=1 Tax=Sphingobacterium detergens TaxID=1145106 RepID=A0A420BH04_SPHD1|nr:helix-turn-helix domain-containing protein [Sphingobacterium detergens]RKE56024.1 AraC-like DNA-binding protein [Sphingobacterium detergens]